MELPPLFLESVAGAFAVFGILMGFATRLGVILTASVVTVFVFVGVLVLSFLYGQPDGVLVILAAMLSAYCGLTYLVGAAAARFLKNRSKT
ncbi:hypothetical protein [Qipengyuania flava]|uniref:hypothetical protein n=1 Tax=Qipengyuania flava TaxID=192812 RepID=UPI001C62F252|nr:hypothetical protein [Qipengyuania flava]QYJ07788.1 hypothetical protein KUV82_03485 [Qipengyuania flava]